MAPRKMKQVQGEVGAETKEKLKVRVQGVKAADLMDKKFIKVMRGRFGEIERQCEELKEETEMIVKQTACTHVKLLLMFKILKAREAGHLTQAAVLTHFLREFVAKERANASLGARKK